MEHVQWVWVNKIEGNLPLTSKPSLSPIVSMTVWTRLLLGAHAKGHSKPLRNPKEVRDSSNNLADSWAVIFFVSINDIFDPVGSKEFLQIKNKHKRTLIWHFIQPVTAPHMPYANCFAPSLLKVWNATLPRRQF